MPRCRPGRARGNDAARRRGARAGAVGVTTSRTTKHKARDGRFTPSLSAREAELFALAEGMKRAGKRRARGQFRLRPRRIRGAGRRRQARRPAPLGAAGPGRCPAEAVARDARPGERRAQSRPRRQCAGRLAADRRDHGPRDDGASLRRPSGVARVAGPAAGRALCPPRRRCGPSPPPHRAPHRRQRACLHGRVVPQDVPDRRAGPTTSPMQRTPSWRSPSARAARRRKWHSK